MTQKSKIQKYTKVPNTTMQNGKIQNTDTQQVKYQKSNI